MIINSKGGEGMVKSDCQKTCNTRSGEILKLVDTSRVCQNVKDILMTGFYGDN